MMATRAAAVSRPLVPSSPSSPASAKVVITPRRPKVPAVPLSSTASISLLALFSAPAASFNEAKAFALPKEDIISSLTEMEKTIEQVNSSIEQGSNFLISVLDYISKALGPAADVVLPAVTKAGEEAIKAASPVISDASGQAKEALEVAGVDANSVISAIKTVSEVAKQTTAVIEGAKPIASSAVETITSSDPMVIATSSGGLLLAYTLLPKVFSALSFNFRGYKGSLSPAQTLDLITSQQYLLIDIRSEKDKSKAGIPRLPSNAKNNLLSIPLEELPNKIKNIVRDSKKVEAELAALKISYLKRVNKGSNIVIMDSYTDSAKVVARTLTELGFKNCWIMTDGFSGGKGWLQSRLGSDSYNTGLVEILSPSRIISGTKSFGTTSSTRSGGKLLSGGIDG